MPSAESFKDEGNNFFKVGKYAEAVEKYKSATALDPNVPAYWYVPSSVPPLE
jgi:tetratricopeptide (TPR) repeat protein